MPTLHWIGKDKVINHHLAVPFRVLEHGYGFANGNMGSAETNSGNKIIHGDNLEALKALLPEYEGKIKCIYIDPPYNTGNEGWVYNDNVNDQKLKKWLHEVVGKEGEDLSRHDKWLCMMYPRLKLLHKLLADDGIIFISIDDNEQPVLRLIVDEIFGSGNRIENIVWKKKYGGGAKTKWFVSVHEYVLCYAKKATLIEKIEIPYQEEHKKYYKYKDAKFKERGPYRLQPLATNSNEYRPNLVYPILFNGIEILPEKQWQWSKDRTDTALKNDEIVVGKGRNGKYSVNFKQYLIDSEGEERKSKPFSIIDNTYTQHGTNTIKEIFGDGQKFQFPKPPNLIEQLLSIIEDKECIVLDSFGGSGTTAHAVLNLNKEDGGNRKFILIEMEPYAETITAERVKRVINGYADKEATSGAFDYYTLGQPLFTEDGNLNETVPLEELRKYIYYTETQQPLPNIKKGKDSPYLLGLHNQTAYYFVFEPGQTTTLDHELLATIRTKAEQYIIYADNCTLTKEFLTLSAISFKKIPRDITRF